MTNSHYNFNMKNKLGKKEYVGGKEALKFLIIVLTIISSIFIISPWIFFDNRSVNTRTGVVQNTNTYWGLPIFYSISIVLATGINIYNEHILDNKTASFIAKELPKFITGKSLYL